MSQHHEQQQEKSGMKSGPVRLPVPIEFPRKCIIVNPLICTYLVPM